MVGGFGKKLNLENVSFIGCGVPLAYQLAFE